MISTSRTRLAVLSLIWLVGAFVVFVLPWHVPQHTPLVSDSYILGFSNKTAIVGLGLVLIALTLCRIFFDQPGGKSADARLARLLHPSRVSAAEWGLVLVFSALFCLGLWLLYRLIPSNQYGEICYPVARLELILFGQKPYQDFEWTYGPLFLYFPALLVKLSGFRLGSDFAYLLSLCLFTTLGFLEVFYILSQFRLKRWQRWVIFLANCSIFNVGLGVNTTQFRFISAFAALFYIHNQALKVEGQQKRKLSLTLQMLAAIAFCFSVSPEVGLVFFTGLLCFCTIQIRRGERWYLGCIAICLGLVGAVAFSSSFFRSASSFASGGSNFPVLPSAPILFFLLTITFTVPLLLSFGWRAQFRSAPVAVGLGAMMTIYDTAALGRCDDIHVFNNGMGLFLLSLAFFTRYRPKFNAYLIGYILIFPLCTALGYYFTYSASVEEALKWNAQGMIKPQRTFLANAPQITDPGLLQLKAELMPLKHVGAPLITNDEIELLLKQSGLYIFEFFPMPDLEVRTRPQLDRKLLDVGKMPYLIIDKRDLHPLQYSPEDFSKQSELFLSQNVLYLVDYQIKNKPFFPKIEIAGFIRSHFTPINTYKNFIIMKNNDVKLFSP